jgi:hypothetical protein
VFILSHSNPNQALRAQAFVRHEKRDKAERHLDLDKKRETPRQLAPCSLSLAQPHAGDKESDRDIEGKPLAIKARLPFLILVFAGHRPGLDCLALSRLS